jgi:hypothetical protein
MYRDLRDSVPVIFVTILMFFIPKDPSFIYACSRDRKEIARSIISHRNVVDNNFKKFRIIVSRIFITSFNGFDTVMRGL